METNSPPGSPPAVALDSRYGPVGTDGKLLTPVLLERTKRDRDGAIVIATYETANGVKMQQPHHFRPFNLETKEVMRNTAESPNEYQFWRHICAADIPECIDQLLKVAIHRLVDPSILGHPAAETRPDLSPGDAPSVARPEPPPPDPESDEDILKRVLGLNNPNDRGQVRQALGAITTEVPPLHQSTLEIEREKLAGYIRRQEGEALAPAPSL